MIRGSAIGGKACAWGRLMGLGIGDLLVSVAIDIGDHAQVLIKFDARAKRAPPATTPPEQAGQLHKPEILEVNDVSASGEIFRLGNRMRSPIEVYTSKV